MNLEQTVREACGADAVERTDGTLVARPKDLGAVRAVVAACRAAGAALALDGVEGEGGAPIRLDLARLDQVRVNGESRFVEAGAGVTVAELEAALARHRLTLGWPETPEVPLGAYLAAAEPGPNGPAAFPGWSPVMGLEAVLLDGTAMKTRPAPRSATGPDLKALLVGGRGRAGIITEAVLRVHEQPGLVRRLVFAFPEYAAAVAATVEALGRDLTPDRFGLLDGGPLETLLTWESHGEPRTVGLAAGLVDEVCGLSGGRRLATEARTGGGPLGAADDGAAGPEEIRAACEAADGRTVAFTCRWSRLAVVRRALLEATRDGARVHAARALPEGVLALACVPEGLEETAAGAVRRAGGWLPGEGDEVSWYDRVGAVLKGGGGEGA